MVKLKRKDVKKETKGMLIEVKGKFVKCYDWRNDILYYLYLPYFIFKGLLGIKRKKHICLRMSKQDYLGLMKGLCDCRAGRLYRWDDD